MSLIKHIRFEIKNIDALKKAAEDRGLLFLYGQQTYQWYGSRTQPCDHAIRVPADTFHELGVIRVGDGTWNLAHDEDSRVIGAEVLELTQRYQYHNTEAEISQLEGCSIESVETDVNGNLLVWVGDNN